MSSNAANISQQFYHVHNLQYTIIIMNWAGKIKTFQLRSKVCFVRVKSAMLYLNVENFKSFQFGDVVDLPLNLDPLILMKVTKATQADLNTV